MKSKLLALAIGLAGLAVWLPAGQALAIIPDDGGGENVTSQSPPASSLKWRPATDDPSTGPLGGNQHAYYVVGNNKDEYNYSRASIPILLTDGDILNLSVWNAGPACHSEQSAGLVGPDYAENASNAGPPTLFSVYGNGGTVLASRTAGATADCSYTADFFNINASRAQNLIYPIGPYTKVVFLSATILAGTSIQGENSFYLDASNSSGDVKIAFGSEITGIGFRFLDLNNGNYWTSQEVVGVDQTCDTLGQLKGGSIKYYDADATKPGWNPNIRIILQKKRWQNDNTWERVAFLDSDYLAKHQDGTLYNGTFNPDFRYRILLANVGVRNTIFLQMTGGISQASGTFHLEESDCGKTTASCKATPTDASLSAGQKATMKVRVTNNSTNGTTFPKTYEVRQVTPGGEAHNLSQPISPKETDDGIGLFNINARSPTKANPTITVIFYYDLFDNTGAQVPNTPQCNASITWRYVDPGCKVANPPPSCNTDPCKAANPPASCNTSAPGISASCSTVTVSGGKSVATWTRPKTAYAPNIVLAAVIGPDGEPLPTGGTGGTGGASPPATTTSTITKIPIKIEMNGNGVAETHYFWIDNTGSDSKSYGTFGTFGGAWPHNGGYTVTVFFVASGDSTTYKDDGVYHDGDYPDDTWVRGGSTDVNNGQPCLDAYCGNPSTIDAEPGQRVSLSYGVHVVNQTDKTFSANDGGGYSFGVRTSGGIRDPRSISPSGDIRPGNPTDININFTARVDYTGTWGITLNYKGNPLTLDQLPGGSCGLGNTGGPGSGTPYTRPFFEVRGGDLATGGCYQSASGSYNTSTDPGYVTPAPSNYNSNKTADSGGIRAFSKPSEGRGSKAEFGVDALGQIFQDTNRFYGFYSTSGVTFANTNTPNPLGGYLNSNSIAHCVPDFYTTTRTGTQSGFSGGSITLPTGQYQANSSVTITGGTVPRHTRITIYVDGDVQINGNITNNPNWDAADANDVPFLAIIAKGNIWVGPGVTRLDGLFIAQPRGAADNTTSGEFSTCNNGDSASYCPSQLVVNGAVIAQRVSLLRSHGTIGPLESDTNGVGQNAGEIFSYSPAMVIGLPYFVQNTVPLSILEGLFSLPPVF